MENRTVSLWINQSEKKSRTVSLWINQSEKKSRTVSLWINQSEKVPCQRVRKRDKPARQEELLTMKYLLKKFRKSQTRFSRKSRKISLQSKRISKRSSGRWCIDERRESIRRRKKIFYKSHQIVLL